MKNKRYKRDLTRLRKGNNRNCVINLSYLYLGNEKILMFLDELKTHPEVTSINLTANNLTNEIIPILCKNSHLHEIKLASNKLSDDVGNHFKKLTTLEILDLSNNLLGNSCLERLAENQSITTLDLSFNVIDNLNVLKNHNTLTDLDVRNNPVDDNGIKDLASHSRLQVLDIGNTQVTKEGLNYFLSSRSSIIRIITWGNRGVNDEIEKALKALGRINFNRLAITVFAELNTNQIPCALITLIFGYMVELIDEIMTDLPEISQNFPELSFEARSQFAFFTSMIKSTRENVQNYINQPF